MKDTRINTPLQYFHLFNVLTKGISRRLVDKVKDSPKLARKMITKMTSPGRRHRRQEDQDIYIVSVNIIHSSGHDPGPDGGNQRTRDVWWVEKLKWCSVGNVEMSTWKMFQSFTLFFSHHYKDERTLVGSNKTIIEIITDCKNIEIHHPHK